MMKSFQPLATATRGKGLWNMFKRSAVIGKRYGFTSRNMDRILTRFADILERFNAKATFPITGAAVARSNGFAKTHQRELIEYAVHGFYHVDHSQLPLTDQINQFSQANQLFTDRGIMPSGFRCPYLRWDDDTIEAIKQSGFLYDSSQALVWDLQNCQPTESYHRVLKFYGAVSAKKYPALPRLDQDLVRIPYCIPDDEALIDRLVFSSEGAMNQIWLDILTETHRLGELFTLGLHPERLDMCESALITTLQKARELWPAVWFARLDEITNWWNARLNSVISIISQNNGFIHLNVSGPDGITVLVRNVNLKAETETWDRDYQLVRSLDIDLQAEKRPFIGVSPSSDPYLISFLKQQGYIVEVSESAEDHTFYLDKSKFSYEDERPLLAEIDDGDFPLIRLGRWPHGARSALCVTGDIDALTIWDYGMRFLGN
jgi:peptidoglycan/xylan/chitin deacetylase (PgdA/CDA1 family)